jgi:hypothetical protein
VGKYYIYFIIKNQKDMSRLRDPRTGRFLPKTTGAQASNATMTLGQKIHRVLTSSMRVFGKKDISGNPTKMGPGASVVIEKTAEIGPTGTNVYRVKKENSSRTFYTTEEEV